MPLPPPAFPCRYFRMAGGTQAHKVFLCMSSAFGKRNDVVDFIGGYQLFLFPALLAERVSGNIPVTDLFPCSAVAFVGSRVPFVFVVPRIHFLLVRSAIFAVRQFRTARITARSFGFLRHDAHLPDINKSPRSSRSKGFCAYLLFPQYHYIT